MPEDNNFNDIIGSQDKEGDYSTEEEEFIETPQKISCTSTLHFPILYILLNTEHVFIIYLFLLLLQEKRFPL